MVPIEAVDALTERIIGCGIEVHRELGPGLLEGPYRDCLILELRAAQLHVERERMVELFYKGHRMVSRFRLDLLIEECVVVEIKAVERIQPLHLAQVITYLKLSRYPAGLLMNFNSTALRAGLRRVNHPEVHARRVAARP